MSVFIPPKAVITTPTPEEAKMLLDFLGDNEYTFGREDPRKGGTKWDTYGIDTCYNLEPSKRICYCYREWYENERESEGRDYCIPADPTWLFIGAADFIALCTGACDDNEDIDVGSIL